MGYGKVVDQVVGKLTHLLHVRATKINTVDQLGPYLDLPPEQLFPEPQGVPHVRRHRPLLSGLRTTETLSWKSLHEPLAPAYKERHQHEYSANLTAYARWLHPRFGKRRSLLLYVHGWLEPGSWVEEATLLPLWYRELLVDVAYVQLPFHGRRSPRGQLFPGEWFWTADLVRSLEAIRQSLCDIRSAILYFRAMGYEEIGVIGLSLGGCLAMLSGCFTPTPDYIVPMIAHLELVEAVEEAPILWRMKADLEAFGINQEKRRAIFERIGFERVMPLVSPDRQLWVAAREDVYLKAELVLRQWRRWKEPNILWLRGGHMTIPLEIPQVNERLKTLPKLRGR